MVKVKRILMKNIFWFILGVITYFFINVVYVKADTIVAPVQYVTSDTTLHLSNKMGVDIQLNSATQNSNNIDIKEILMNINYNFKGNVIYQIELSTPTQYLINVNNVSIVSNDNTCSFKGITDANVGFPKIRFTCPYDTNYVVINLSNLSDNNITSSYNFRWNYTYLSIVNENVVDLNPVLDGQGQIKDEITGSTNTITGSINDMEQSIIDSNKETQDVIKDQFNSCRDSYNLLNVPKEYTLTGFQSIGINLTPGTYTLSAKSIVSNSSSYKLFILRYSNGTTKDIVLSNVTLSNTFIINSNATLLTVYSDKDYSSSQNVTTTFNELMLQEGSVATKWEEYGKEICQNKIDDTNNKLDDLNNSLNNSNSSGATNDASNFFSNFTTDTFGLTSIITAPLSLINNITSSSCSTLRLPIPYLDNEYLELPCMSTIYTKYFGSFFSIYQTITFGIVSYWVIVRIFNQVKDFKNPDHDEIEVLDL